MSKKIPSTDKTYCYGIFCEECESCQRYAGHYDFDKDTNYWFMYRCINYIEKEGSND